MNNRCVIFPLTSFDNLQDKTHQGAIQYVKRLLTLGTTNIKSDLIMQLVLFKIINEKETFWFYLLYHQNGL